MTVAGEIRRGIARAQNGTAVFRDGRCIGFIVGRRCGFDALTDQGEILGRFNQEPAAARAILARLVGGDG